MSKAFIQQIIQEKFEMSNRTASMLTNAISDAIIHKLKTDGKFTWPTFGTFTIRDTPARAALNPKTQEPIKVKAGRTVRFKVSPSLRKDVTKARKKRKG